jgi:hypothetical protein
MSGTTPQTVLKLVPGRIDAELRETLPAYRPYTRALLRR